MITNMSHKEKKKLGLLIVTIFWTGVALMISQAVAAVYLAVMVLI